MQPARRDPCSHGVRWKRTAVRARWRRSSVPGALTTKEEPFLTSIEISRSPRAKSLELRATTSLTRLFDKQGKRDEARTMLAEIYNWFTEGFDAADLKDAKELLEELN
jgi:hypothetical protein